MNKDLEILLGKKLAEKLSIHLDGKIREINNIASNLFTPSEWKKIEAIRSVVAGYCQQATCVGINISSCWAAYNAYRTRFIGEDREHLVALYLNGKNRVRAEKIVSIGTINMSVAHPREIFKEAIRISAVSLILIHNHPSGDCTPSPDDDAMTRRIAEAGTLVGIKLLDHIVIGDGVYYSYAESNKL